MVAFDINDDKNIDIIVANTDANAIGISLNRGNGTFMPQKFYAIGHPPSTLTVVDIDGDTKSDIVTTNIESKSISIILSSDNGTLIHRSTYSIDAEPTCLVVLDVNDDDQPDIIVASKDRKTPFILSNIGDGKFVDITLFFLPTQDNNVFRFITATDVNGDNKLDILVMYAYNERYDVYFNKGNGIFTYANLTMLASSYTGEPSCTIAIDINGDTKSDIVKCGSLSTCNILLGICNDTFISSSKYSTSSIPIALAVRDINGDNQPDIILAYSKTNNIGIFYNTGNGMFTDENVLYSVGRQPNSITTADVNSDGYNDIIVSNYMSNTITVLLSYCE